MKRIFALFLAVSVSAGALAGCSGGSGAAVNSVAPATQSETAAADTSQTETRTEDAVQTEAEPAALVELSVAIWNIEEGLSGGDNDAMLKTLEEKTGVRLTPQNITWDDAEQKIMLWAANGQLPDIFAGDFVTRSFYHEWAAQGIIHALPDDLSAYPNLAEYLQMERAVSAKQNGKYYMIPRQTYGDITYSSQDRNVAYRWDLAQKAGVTKEPETYDEFRDMIRKIIEVDPEDRQISGMTQINAEQIVGFINPYGGILDKKWVYKDGQFVPGYFAGDMQAAFQLVRDMYEEGTIEQDIALAKLDIAKEKFLQGQAAAIAHAGSPTYLYNQLGKDYEELYGRPLIDDIKFAKLYPGADGQKYYWVDTEAWSESYISGTVDDTKLDAICRLYDFLYSQEGRRLMFAGIEGVDYDMADGAIQLREDIKLGDKYPFYKSGASCLALWNPDSWDIVFPSASPKEWLELNVARHNDAVNNGTLPKYYDAVLFLSTPLKDAFAWNAKDDLIQVMQGTEPVDKMISDLLAGYESKGYSAMIKEVNEAAAAAGIQP